MKAQCVKGTYWGLTVAIVLAVATVVLIPCDLSRGLRTSSSPLMSPRSATSVLPTPQAAMPLETYFTTTLALPDGRILPVECSQCCADIPRCAAQLPNGVRFSVVEPIDYSPDNRFAVICVEKHHDTPCLWYQVINLTDGERLWDFSPDYWHQWISHGGHTLAYSNFSNVAGMEGAVVLWDVETGQRRFGTCLEVPSTTPGVVCVDDLLTWPARLPWEE